jgi:hypothetical protein
MERSAVCVGLMVLALSGCGGSNRPATLPVRGIVLLDNEPVAGAAVMFHPVGGGRPAEGVTGADGRFELKTFEEGDGALPGEHQVTVTKMEVEGITGTADGLSGPIDPAKIKEIWHVPQRYAAVATSQLTSKVEKGMDEVKLELQGK